MIVNIDQQHEELLTTLGLYWDELKAWRRSLVRFTIVHPVQFFTLALPAVLAQRKKAPIDMLSGRTDKDIREVAPKFADRSRSAAEKERLADLIADFSVHVIAEKMLLIFPDYDFAKVKKLHDARRTDRLKLSTTKIITGLLTVAAFLGKFVPKSVVEGDLHWKYELFEKGLFYITSLLVLSFGIILVDEWLTIKRETEKHEYIGRILFYLDLVTSKAKA